MSTRFLVRPQGRIAYEETGAGPLVVLVPSIGDLRQEYRFLAPRLVAAGYRVVAMDLRGLGESSTGWDDYSAAAVGSDVVALLRELNAGPAHLVGTSMGAGAVAWAAAEVPDLVQSLVLISPFVRAVPLDSTVQRAALWAMVNVGLARPWGALAWSSYYDSLYPTVKPADLAAYRDALKANLREKGRLEAVQAMMRADNAGIEARLGAVRAPTLVVVGTKDPDFAWFPGGPEGEARLIAERLRGEVLLADGAGHYPHVELPELVNSAIVRFVQRQQGA
ncbi:MAG TPA: alpha/beta hydrolase [Chloroflexota bacterium]